MSRSSDSSRWVQRVSTIYTTGPGLRMNKRHDLGDLFEDFGTTLQKDSQNKRNQTFKRSQPLRNKFTPSTKKPTATRPVTNCGRGWTGGSRSRKTASPDTRSRSGTIELSDSQSADEMDLLSQKSSLPDPTSFQKCLQDSHMSSTSHGCNEKVSRDSQGKVHQDHKGFQPGKFFGLKFNKYKVAKPPQTSSQASPTFSKSSLPSSHEDNIGGLMHSKRPEHSRMGGTVYVNHTDTWSRSTTHWKRGNTSESPTTATANKPPRKPIPKPRPVGRIAHLSSQIKPASVTVLDVLPVGSSPPRLKSPSRSRTRFSSPKATVRQPAAFPVLTPPASPVTRPRKITGLISPLRESNSDDGRRLKQQPSALRLPDPFPVLSPPYNQRKEEMDGSHIKRSKDKGKMKENEDGSLFVEPEDGSPTTAASKSTKSKRKETERRTAVVKEKDRKQKKPRKFPMSTQMLESIGSSPDTDSRRGKRLPDEGSEDERVKKKSKKRQDLHSQSLSHTFEEEGDWILNSDPRSLCPYCDSRLPAQPTPLLVRLLAATKEKAKPDPRPSNPLGLKAPMAVFVSVCQRHRFESEILPEAQRKGWPKTIEWKAVAERVMKMKRALQVLIDDTGGEDEWEVAYSQRGKGKGQGPKSSSIFWNEVMEEIKQKGTRAAAGVRGQFANFDKAQPGYYGEQGSVIINQTLYDMFPPSSMDSHSIAPLTGNEFMQKILVPEVALRLIMEDRNLGGEEGRREALITLRESSTYGVFMFPEDGGEGAFAKKSEGDRLGVGDMIVMERAMKRRKELEEEEQKEERLMAVEREIVKAVGNSCATDTSEDVEVMKVGRAPPKPRPRPVGKASSTMSVASSQGNLRSTQHRSRSQSTHDDTDPASGIDTAIEISDSDSNRGVRVTRCRSPPTSRGRRQLSYTRSTSRGLNLSSESESSSKAVVGGRCTRSRSRSIARLTGRAVHEIIKEDDIDIMFTDSTKTPTRRMDMAVDTETPKTARPSTGAKLPPLLQAQQRRQLSVTSEKGLLRQLIPSSKHISTEKTKPPLPSRQNSANRVSSKAKSGYMKTPLPPQRNASNNVITSKTKSGPRRSPSESKLDDYNWLIDAELPGMEVKPV